MENISVTSLHDIEKWRSQLKLSDSASSAKALYHLLMELNQAPINAKQRFKILSVLRPTVSYICQALQKLYASQEILSEQQVAIVDLVLSLRHEMMKGYRYIIEDSLKSVFINKKLLLSSVQNAMLNCLKMLTQVYEHHRQPPVHLWRSLHSLYLLAEKKNIADNSLLKTIDWNCGLNTLQDIYKYCLLFVIADPYQLRHDEIVHLMHAMESWAPLVRLSKKEKKGMSPYIVDLLSDAPPKHTSTNQECPQEYYYITLDKVEKHLQDLLTEIKSTERNVKSDQFLNTELSLPYHYVESLLLSWNDFDRIVQQRKKAHGYVNVTLGVAACCWFASKNHVTPTETSASEKQEISETINIDLLPTPMPQLEIETQRYRQYTCELVDESEGGYCLKWIKEVPPPIKMWRDHCLRNTNPRERQSVGNWRHPLVSA